MKIYTIVFALISVSHGGALALCYDLPKLGDKLTEQQVTVFANLPLSGMDREYPNKPSNVMVSRDDILSPKEMHPAFYGCFDWHSSVHGHWMLVRLIRAYPGCSVEDKIRKKLDVHLTAENMEAEAKYFGQSQNRSFERTYGWAWALKLVAELHEWNDEQGTRWRENLRPLEKIIVAKTMDYLAKLSFPIRSGVHHDTAFALGQILDYARAVDHEDLEKLIVQRSRDFYLNDRDYPVNYEPSGEDFFSAGLNEADLMRRVLPQREFAKWLEHFMPKLGIDKNHPLLIPVDVSDVTDEKIVHLAGLDLSRAWCLQEIANSLPNGDPRLNLLQVGAAEHADKGLEYVCSGHYAGEHWLATFAIYVLSLSENR